ncbi:MAG: Xaa-Pro peptidase family protein [Phyllobacteriaceae bacterium]|nr:Xaa-Pro peptidase family protein [Phyllobacteriaceae bacterium]
MTAHETRVLELQQRLKDDRLVGALVCDPDSIFYLSGYWGYASFVSCGRPNMLWVPVSGEPEIITPLMELEMCQGLSRVGRIHGWVDGVENEWRKPLGKILGQADRTRIAADIYQMPALVSRFLTVEFPDLHLLDLSAHLAQMRLIKSADEIQIMRHAGSVAVAMAAAAEAVIARGIPEFEVSLAAMAAGSRKAAEILDSEGHNGFDSPMIHNLQIMQSGTDTCMVHRRPTTRCICCGDPVYLCFCGITVFRGYWLGFDREFFCESVTDERARTYEVCIAAQMAALETIRPGVTAEEVHFAADAVYQDAGFSPTYRTGRGTGCSILEAPELKAGNKTRLKSGMTLVIDGGITVPGDFGARVGDSVVVTDDGFEYLTPYPKELRVLS